jgi:hypothetical protein
MSDCPDWRARTSRPVRVDTRTGTVGYVIEETETEVLLRLLTGSHEWTVAREHTRPATPCDVADALMDE